ncbi:mitochondrial ribosomal small subunit component [Coemansia sp. RSA 2618]|nr:mitochondrial ribosomal small subunit component [Coemansia sp. RSA 2618]
MHKKPSAPRGIRLAYEHLLSAKLRGVVPPWLHAMRSTPPADSLVRDPSMFATRGKMKFEDDSCESSQQNDTSSTRIRRTLPVGCVSFNHKKKHMHAKCNRPPKIVFPEDSLRKEFFKNHPFETFRPRTLTETSKMRPQTWSQLSDGTGQVTGENVIRYQYYLMQTKGMSKHDAYSQATEEFYAIRAREEMEAKIAQQEAHFYGAHALKKPFSVHQLRVEDAEIRKSAEAFKRRQEEERMKDSMATEKMFAATEE